jgi:hypothetical protein
MIPHHTVTPTAALIDLLILLESTLRGGLRFKLTRATDGALHISVHASGETRALYKNRIPVRDLAHVSTQDILTSISSDLRTHNLTIHA